MWSYLALGYMHYKNGIVMLKRGHGTLTIWARFDTKIIKLCFIHFNQSFYDINMIGVCYDKEKQK